MLSCASLPPAGCGRSQWPGSLTRSPRATNHVTKKTTRPSRDYRNRHLRRMLTTGSFEPQNIRMHPGMPSAYEGAARRGSGGEQQVARATVIGPDVAQVDYRLTESAGCGLTEEHGHDA